MSVLSNDVLSTYSNCFCQPIHACLQPTSRCANDRLHNPRHFVQRAKSQQPEAPLPLPHYPISTQDQQNYITQAQLTKQYNQCRFCGSNTVPPEYSWDTGRTWSGLQSGALPDELKRLVMPRVLNGRNIIMRRDWWMTTMDGTKFRLATDVWKTLKSFN
jgi:hypothetical protein